MPCRIGITTVPEERRAYWENRVTGFSNWKVIAQYSTKVDAQSSENYYSEKYGCVSAPGGEDAPGPWHVYYFEYISDLQA